MSAIVPISSQSASIEAAARRVAYGLSETSKRQYAHTFSQWLAWCAAQDINRLDLTDENVIAFLESAQIGKATKQARLTHLRRLAQTLYAGDTTNAHFKNCFEQLKLLRIAADDRSGQKRDLKALNVFEVCAAFDVWNKDTNLHSRNRALLAVLFYAGLRRAEAVALKWSDIDFKQGLVTVLGKGSKERTVPFASAQALKFLKDWKARAGGREYVFPHISKAGRLGADKPVSTETVRLICKQSGDFKPHDARRTLLSDLLASGTSLPDAQFIAGHRQGQTTMRYAKVKDANEVKGRLRLSY